LPSVACYHARGRGEGNYAHMASTCTRVVRRDGALLPARRVAHTDSFCYNGTGGGPPAVCKPRLRSYAVWSLLRRSFVKIKIDRDACLGEGLCVTTAPGVFDLDDEEKCIVLDASAADEQTILEAAQGCPVEAIILMDDNGEQIFPK